MNLIQRALQHRYNSDVFQRVVYSESHDEVANGKSRVPSEIDPADPTGWFAQKRSTLAAALVFTAPGIPMIFQGQEFLKGGWFDDSQGIDWDQEHDCRGILRLYRDLIHLRRNLAGATRGLTGQHLDVHHCNDGDKVVAFRRWADGGPGDEVLVVANFANRGEDFGNLPSGDATAEVHPYDNQPHSASLKLAPYSVLIYSQDP
jgi:1,4-alpha-glucan branching enzyme